MQITNLKLKNFRNYDFLDMNFEKNWNILVGQNGAGKTNLLEAIYYNISTRSPRTKKIENLIKSGRNEFSINLEFKNFNSTLKSNIKTSYSNINSRIKKSIKLNLKEIKMLDLIGIVPFVFFVPEDIFVIKGESFERRRLFDFVLFQIFPNYKFLVNRYNEILKKRNVLIKEIKLKKNDTKYLEEWDEILIQTGIEISQKRNEICEILNEKLKSDFYKIYFKEKNLSIEYLSILKSSTGVKSFENKDCLYKIYKELLQKNYQKDITYGFTTTGIHRDDFQFFFDNKDMKIYGSQGQQRLYILTLKILLADIMKMFLQKNPILIFDDIFSELDMKNTKILIENCSNNINAQIFVAAVDVDKILKNNLFENKKFTIFEIKNQRINN